MYHNNADDLNMKAYQTDFEIEAADDPDEYDDAGEANEPNSPIWQDSEVQSNYFGNDPSSPDLNEISRD